MVTASTGSFTTNCPAHMNVLMRTVSRAAVSTAPITVRFGTCTETSTKINQASDTTTTIRGRVFGRTGGGNTGVRRRRHVLGNYKRGRGLGRSDFPPQHPRT